MFEETHEETDDIAKALILQMDKEEEEDRTHEKEEVLHGQWVPARHDSSFVPTSTASAPSGVKM
jgi:hypothetical protein